MTSDEQMHPVGDDAAWSESYYFNFVDPHTRLGMFTRMGFRPGNGWADALHVIYLTGTRVAFTYGRREIGPDLTVYDRDLAAGNLSIECLEPFERWRVRYEGPAQDIADAGVLLERRKSRPEGWFAAAALDMDVTFDCLTEPHYAGSDDRSRGAYGHFEQSGRVQGSIGLGDERWEVAGFGVRDKSWGPRDWGAGVGGATDSLPSRGEGPAPFVNWFSMNFAEAAAMGGSCFRGPDGEMRGAGWIQQDGTTEPLNDVVIESAYRPGSILHTAVSLRARTASGQDVHVIGKVLNVCPTKIAMPGGATFVNEGLAEFRWGDRVGFGIAEHWHAVKLG